MNRTAGNLAFTTSEQTLATLTLPAGNYLLFAKASIVRTGGTSGTVCTLYNGTTSIDQLNNQTSTTGELAKLQSFVQLSAQAVITFKCNGQTGVSATASNRTLTAIKVNTLTVQ